MKYLLLASIVLLFFVSCKKTSQLATSTKDQFYFKGTVNGQNINWSSNTNPGLLFLTGGGPSFRPDSGKLAFIKYQIGTEIRRSVFQGNILSAFSIHYISPFMPGTFNNVINSFGVGTKQFARISFTNTDSVSEGISISYVDSTDYESGFGDQSTGTFETISLKDATPDKEYTKILTARFSCKVYEPYGCKDTVYHPTKIIEIKDAEICVPLFQKSDYF